MAHPRAFSSDVKSGSRDENASKQKIGSARTDCSKATRRNQAFTMMMVDEDVRFVSTVTKL